MPAVSNRSVADKLGIKSGKTVWLVNQPKSYESTLGKVADGAYLFSNPKDPVDIIQVFVKSREELEKVLPQLKKQLKPSGALWVSFYKGSSKNKSDINRDDVHAFAATIGLEGVAIISVDDDWSSLRLKLVQ